MLGGASRLDLLPLPSSERMSRRLRAAANMARSLRSSRDGNYHPLAAFGDGRALGYAETGRAHNLLMKRQILMT